jgi:hypothetical protein
MNTMAQRLADTVCTNGSRPRCFTCLAAQHSLDEHEVRAVALVLICRAGLGLARRVCASCGRAEETLVVRKAA